MPRTPHGLILAEEHPPTPRRRFVLRGLAVVFVGAVVLAGVVGARTLLEQLNPPACWTTGAARVEVTPEQAGNAATISAVAVQRGLPTRAATIAVATAIQESKLRNLRYGDRDSLGLFQQRPSQGWGTTEQILNPVYSANAFYDRLVKVQDYLTRPLTEVAQDVQRSGAPAAYAQHEDEAAPLAAALAGAAPRTLVCRLAAAPSADAAAVTRALSADWGLDGATAGSTVTLEADGQLGWAVAAWAVARAEALGVIEVRVADASWSRAHPETWSVGQPGRPGASQVMLLLQPAGR